MAQERTLARRYARAVLEIAREARAIDAVKAEVHALAELWDGSPELRTVIAHPSIHRARRHELVGAALEGKVSDLTLRFARLLIDKGRFSIIADIASELSELADEAQDLARARVCSFMPLTDAQRERLRERLRRFTARHNVVLDEVVDPALLGGIKVRIGGRVLDGSVAGKLRRLRERLLLREEEQAQLAAAAAAEALRG